MIAFTPSLQPILYPYSELVRFLGTVASRHHDSAEPFALTIGVRVSSNVQAKYPVVNSRNYDTGERVLVVYDQGPHSCLTKMLAA